MAHGIDHLVLPVRDLDVTRDRYSALGFSVAPDARHPFGTENACIFFQNRTYLEPLAVASRIEMEENARKGLTFLRRFDAYRFRNGREGFSKLAMTSLDAEADNRRYAEAGLAAGDVFSFERPLSLPDGSETTIGVKLAFAVDERAPDITFFACQHINTESFWDPGRTTHPNGALGVAEVVIVEENPTDFQYDLLVVSGERDVHSSSLGLHVDLPKGAISIVTPTAFSMMFGREADISGRGLKLSAFVVDVADLDQAKSILDDNGIGHSRRGNRLVVPPAPGQGTVIAIQESSA